ncbi:unnamed protein product, partial [Ectocarpus sp. 4 AP-2014]
PAAANTCAENDHIRNSLQTTSFECGQHSPTCCTSPPDARRLTGHMKRRKVARFDYFFFAKTPTGRVHLQQPLWRQLQGSSIYWQLVKHNFEGSNHFQGLKSDWVVVHKGG